MAKNPRKTWLAPEHVIDVFVYVVVLNLVAQYAPHVMTETFATSLLVALLLKVVLELVLMLKKLALRRVRGASGSGRAVGVVTLLVLLPASKFVVLVLVDVVFGDAVSLGGFFAVTGLIILLMAARGGVRWLLGEPDAARV